MVATDSPEPPSEILTTFSAPVGDDVAPVMNPSTSVAVTSAGLFGHREEHTQVMGRRARTVFGRVRAAANSRYSSTKWWPTRYSCKC